ncbi:MAG TPA: AAA family ATPase [Pseudobacteroides sp.]|uniref:protein kinase domain-containing protein n=1 Tax=Pseudobacteroides sp. TaxID=1968840 RepID=UPI002F943F7F
MIRLSGYKIVEEISRGSNSIVLRGTRNLDDYPVVVKLLNKEYPSIKELSVFMREYEIMDKIGSDGIIKAYGIEKYNNSIAIIMEDIGGESVDKALHSIKPGIVEKLLLAIQMANCLNQLHKQNIIHKDVNPSNFIWNNKTNQVKIIDFGISAELIREASQCINLNILEGSLYYVSPEQTGRINRPIDYRTDLYSLGITFYQLFTGQLPFKGGDELELIYSHIAKAPIAPNVINPEIPAIISDIVMKLISKTVEDRYQSALGLKKDLEQCLQFIEGEKGTYGFALGAGDNLDRFEIPHKLYGREKEIKMLINGFEKAANGHCELLLVSGYSGIGKSSLIHEIRKPITGKKGYFITGKYNQFERDVPYYGITQAFKELIRQLLVQSQSSLDIWKSRLTDALGCNGQVILDILPELEQIVGPQSQVSELNPLEAQNRFKMIFREFINVFARQEHPLVIFLDDLQWSDTSTLDLVKYILETGSAHYILFIGAYRDNEVKVGHPLHKLLEDLKNGQQGPTLPFNQILLKPLEFSAINRLIADTLHSHPNDTKSLTNIILQKTDGNPFFVRRVLSSLYLQETFTFLSEKGQWVYDLEKVKAVEISDNVVDLLVKGLKSLPVATMDILKLVACIGSKFDLTTVSLISKKSVAVLGKDLWIAIEKEIILPLNNNYRLINTLDKEMNPTDMEMRFCFAHDRIRQAVYSLIPEREKCEIHLDIGNEYLKSFREAKQTEAIFDMINHLNIGRDLVVQKDERIELADLNIIAGNKAKKSTAFEVALNYFETAKSLLFDEEWALVPEKFFALLLEQATAALLTGDLLKADTICEHLSEIAGNNLEKGAVTNIKVLILIFQGKLNECINEIRNTLLLFNISLPVSDEEIEKKMQEGVMKMQQFLARTPVEELVNLPVMNDPEKLMAMQLLFQAVPPSRQVNPTLYFLVLLMMFELTCTYGVSPLSCGCFVNCGVIQGRVLGDYKTGYKLGEAAFALANKLKAESEKTSVYFIFPFLSYWRTHYQESLDYYDIACRTGLETGDLMHLTYAIAHKVHLLMWVGKNLTECKAETESTIDFLKHTKGNVPLVLADIVYYTIQKFQTISEHNDQLDFEEKDKEMIKRIESIHNIVYLARFYVYNTYVNVVMDNMEEAEKWNVLADKIIFAGVSDFIIPDHYLFKALVLIYKWNNTTPQEQTHIKEVLINIQQKLKYWAENCPANFEHKYYLICAAMAIIQNESIDTIIDLFQKAMDSIKNNDYIQIKAICNELFGKFWIARGNETIGKAYIREAHYLYKQWGAYRKVMLLEKQYAHYFYANETNMRVINATEGTIGLISKMTHSSIDMTSILKSNQAISSEIKFEKLLTILIRIMIENAGAERGCLLLKNEVDGQLYMEVLQDVNFNQLQVIPSLLFTESKELCHEIVQYVIRTNETVVIHDACLDVNWQNNPYIIDNQIKSVLCMPVFYQNRLKSVVYLENNLSDNVFTSERLETLKILSSQASISIENARLYENMEEKVRERTIQLNNANEKLRELSLHDPLTSLHNRRYAFEFVYSKITQFIGNKAMLLNDREKRKQSIDENVIGVFLIDIDHFKEVNDTYGHSAGDSVLISISKVLKQMVRADDILVRWGGEEFLIILYNVKPEYLDKFSKRVIEEVNKTPIEISPNKTINKTCSIGYVQMPLEITTPDLLNLEQMINISDYALYCAKEKGRNCAAHFRLIKSIGTEDELKDCLMNLSKDTKLNEEYFKIEFI